MRAPLVHVVTSQRDLWPIAANKSSTRCHGANKRYKGACYGVEEATCPSSAQAGITPVLPEGGQAGPGVVGDDPLHFSVLTTSASPDCALSLHVERNHALCDKLLSRGLCPQLAYA